MRIKIDFLSVGLRKVYETKYMKVTDKRCSEKQFLYSLFNHQPYKMLKHTQRIRRQKPTNCLSVFVHFVGLALKGLKYVGQEIVEK